MPIAIGQRTVWITPQSAPSFDASRGFFVARNLWKS